MEINITIAIIAVQIAIFGLGFFLGNAHKNATIKKIAHEILKLIYEHDEQEQQEQTAEELN
ncbi:MAG: hypothetical protein FWD38_09180 [Oscillospiraceae bacterium]|nr:hypothetical protein [Oscillospiraceae bacterium]